MYCRFSGFKGYFRLKVARMLSDATDMKYFLSKEREKANMEEHLKGNIEYLYMTGFKKARIVKLLILSLEAEVFFVIDIDLDDVNEVAIYEAFNVDGNESEALNDSYLELFELIGRDAMLKLFKYFRGDKIDCPMRLYRPEFMADLAKQTTDRRERAKIARAGGYTAKFIEGVLHKRRDEEETE